MRHEARIVSHEEDAAFVCAVPRERAVHARPAIVPRSALDREEGGRREAVVCGALAKKDSVALARMDLRNVRPQLLRAERAHPWRG
eukprot:SAG31_NODE_16385_length_711_cov_0.972222_1_plen_86_part_00